MTRDAADGRGPDPVPRRPVRLAVVDDVDIVVAGVAGMLGPYADRVRVVEVPPAGPAPEDVDVVLFDTDVQTEDARTGLEVLLGRSAAAARTSAGQRPRVVVFSWNVDPARDDAALQRGASGYLSKGIAAADLVTAVEQVHAGDRVRPEAKDDDDPGAWPGRAEGLSLRESTTIAMITQGLSNREIAERSFLSINSVKTYIRSAYRKIGVTSRSQAVLWGLQHGLDAPCHGTPGAEAARVDLTRHPPPRSADSSRAAGG